MLCASLKRTREAYIHLSLENTASGQLITERRIRSVDSYMGKETVGMVMEYY